MYGGVAEAAEADATTPPSKQCSLCRSLRGVFCVPLAAGCILAMTMLYTAQDLLYNVESLDIPGRHVSNATPAADNFCSGYLTNTVYVEPEARHTSSN